MLLGEKMESNDDLEGYAALEELALDLIWSWDRSADEIWEQLDADLFERTHNPWFVLQTISRVKLKGLLKDPTFRKSLDALSKIDEHCHDKSETWFSKTHPKSPLTCVAYFSMEFMLSEALPIYSGGLGNVAGDQLKAASDLGVPVVGVGLLYQQGYFRQLIDRDGNQQAIYPYNSPGQLPIVPLRNSNGEWLRIEIALPGWSLWCRAWEVKVGRVKLYLLDSNDLANYPAHRGVTGELYGGDSEMRLKQELILGIGGWRLLEQLGLKPEVCHLNEGHAAFAILERIKSCRKEGNLSFEEALAATRAGNFFTTHTAVPAGFDRFSPDLIEKYLTVYAETHLGISIERLLDLGRQNQDEPFNMAYLAIRGSGAVGGVSQLHKSVSQRIFEPLFPRRPIDEIPIGYVTNGVHTPSWHSEVSKEFWEEECGNILKAADEKIWSMRNDGRARLIEYVQKRMPRILAARGRSQEEIEQSRHYLNPKTLTLGFARRFATYKRPNMLLHDQERLLRILTNPDRPVQLLIAGKAHPADFPGQEMIREWFEFIHRPEVRPHVVFLSDYDMLMAEQLVQGVDVWINTPRRPWEACGTSGMKVLVNGGLNLSELDGWWAEAYSPKVGWALGDGQEHGDDPAWDAHEACQLYDLLEREVIPEFYQRDKENLPITWISKIRASMSQLTEQFSASRAVREYTEKHYLTAAENFRKRSLDHYAMAKKIAAWQKSLSENWGSVRFGEVKITSAGASYTIEVSIYLGAIDPAGVKIEVYAGGTPPFHQEMKRTSGASGTHTYQTQVPGGRPVTDYCPRAVPYFPGVNTPLESPQILWQR